MPLLSWEGDWKIEWRTLWEILWYDLKGWIKYSFWWNAYLRAVYWGYIKDDIGDLAAHVTKACAHYANAVTDDIEEWALGILGLEAEPTTKVYDHITNIWNSIVALWAKFGYDISNTEITVVDWVREEIDDALEDYDPGTGSIWDSITALWARFGYEISNPDTTVVQWVKDNYDTAKDQADAAATWIATTGAPAALWITTTGQGAADWVTDNGNKLLNWHNNFGWYYENIFNKYKFVLLLFLDDPKGFIFSYIEDYLEGTEEKPGPAWWKELLAFLLSPMRWLLDLGALFWGTLEAFIVQWLNENFPSVEEVLAAISPPDLGLPTVEDWLRGLREPETEEEKAYVALLDTKLQQILDDTIGDHPLTNAEFSSLFFNAPEVPTI